MNKLNLQMQENKCPQVQHPSVSTLEEAVAFFSGDRSLHSLSKGALWARVDQHSILGQYQDRIEKEGRKYLSASLGSATNSLCDLDKSFAFSQAWFPFAQVAGLEKPILEYPSSYNLPGFLLTLC